jgi:thioesterase domain-containing protein
MAVGDEELLRWFLRDAGISPQALTVGAAVNESLAEEPLASALEAAQGSGSLPADMSRAQLSRLLAVFKTNMRAMWNYSPPPMRGSAERITLLRAASPPREEFRRHPAAQDRALGWAALCARSVDVRAVPGDHYSILSQPNVRALADGLQSCLNPSSEEGDA